MNMIKLHSSRGGPDGPVLADWMGKSTEDKPENALEGSVLYTYDDGKFYISDGAGNWVEQEV